MMRERGGRHIYSFVFSQILLGFVSRRFHGGYTCILLLPIETVSCCGLSETGWGGGGGCV